jgi:hypothetical protein
MSDVRVIIGNGFIFQIDSSFEILAPILRQLFSMMENLIDIGYSRREE